MAYSQSLNSILDDEFVTELAKSADLYKIGSNSVLDPAEIRIGLKVVPRAVMSMLISELSIMEINSSKQIQLPFGRNAWISVNKNAADDYTGSVYDNNKLVYDFKNRSIPGLGIILLSTFELYNLEELSKPQHEPAPDADRQIQKLIDERMELHSLVAKVVENKLAEREAIHRLMMSKLTEALQEKRKISDQISEVTQIATDPRNTATEYGRGMANGLLVADSVANDKYDPKFIEPPKTLDIKPSDVIKKEPSKKELPLKKFLDRKKPKEYHVEIAKSETVDCESCGQTIFGPNLFSCCICYGEDQHKKIWIKKSENGIIVKFSKSWNPENIEILLECLRRKNE